MQSTAPDRNTVTGIVKSTGTGVWSTQDSPAGLVVVLSSGRASDVAPVLEAAGYPVRTVNTSTLIVYGTDPVAVIDAQIQALQAARARLTAGSAIA